MLNDAFNPIFVVDADGACVGGEGAEPYFDMSKLLDGIRLLDRPCMGNA